MKQTLRLFSIILLAGVLGACASNSKNGDVQDGGSPQTSTQENPDRFEGYNRAVFKFNDTLDRWVLKPVAKGYDWAFPGFVKSGVGNFFDNLGELQNIVNDGLQWKWKQAANDSGRFLLNTTFGLVGFFDVASKVGLEKSDGENFSQTLAVWGVPRGPYFVIPFLGPSTVRGGVTLPVDWVSSPIYYVNPYESQVALTAVEIVDDRADLLDAEDLISGDRYLFVREAYMQRQEFLEQDGEVVDDFGGGFEDDDYGDFDDYED